MAYTMKFKTLWGNDCEVVVTPAGGGSGTLIASEEPFEMETDDSTDIDTTLRATTGTLRFIVPEGGEEVLDAILPSTLLGTKVEVYLTDAGTSTRVCKFAGYVELTEYSQPWDSAPYEMELPVRDALSIMEEVRMEVGDATLCETMNVASVIYEAFESVGIEPAGLHMESTTQEELNTLMQREWLLEKATEEEGGETTTYMRGMLWSDIIERVLLPLGYTMWMEEGYVRLRRRSVPSLVYTFSWGEVKDIAGGSSAGGTLSTIDILAMRDALTNMSTGNTRGYVPGAARVLLKEKLDEVSVFEFDDDFITWKLNSMYYNSGKETAWEWHAETTQRGVTLHRGYVNSSHQWVPMSTSRPAGYRFSEGINRPVYGGVLCDITGYETEDAPQQNELPKGSTPSVVFPIMDGQDDLEGEDYITEEELKTINKEYGLSAVDCEGVALVDVSKTGCLCLTGSLNFVDVGNAVPYWMVAGASSEEIGTMIVARIKMTSMEGGRTYYYQNEYHRAMTGTYDAPDEWVEDEDAYCYLQINRNGKIEMNSDSNEVTIDFRSGGSNTYFRFYVLPGFLQKERFRYKDYEGFLIDLSKFPGTGLYKIEVGFYSLMDIKDKDSYLISMAHRIMNRDSSGNRYLMSLSDIKVKWCPACLDNDIPEPGVDPAGSYEVNYIEVPDERTYVCTYKGENGEDEEIDFDTWGDSDGLKWGNTVQPNMLKKDVWDAASKQYTRRRRTVEYDDARLTEEVPKFYIDGGISLIKIGGTWQAWNEGGRKKFVEVL